MARDQVAEAIKLMATAIDRQTKATIEQTKVITDQKGRTKSGRDKDTGPRDVAVRVLPGGFQEVRNAKTKLPMQVPIKQRTMEYGRGIETDNILMVSARRAHQLCDCKKPIAKRLSKEELKDLKDKK